MKNNTLYIIGAIGLVVFVGFAFSKGRTTSSTASPTITPASIVTTRGAQAPTATTNDPQDIVPGMYPNPIKNASTATGLSIVSGLVENNIDAAGKITDDHLEILIKNDSKQDMTNMEAYYTVSDPTTGKSEGYYKKLPNLVIKSGESVAVHFDGKNIPNHYGVNKDGIYFTSKNKLQFVVEVSAPGFKTAQLSIAKDAGGAEVKD